MSDIESRLRVTFGALESQAPPGDTLVAGARRLARRRQHRLLAGSTTVVAAAVVAVIAVVPLGHGQQEAVLAGPSTPSAPATRLVSSLGVEMAVPQDWTNNNVRCASPRGKTVLFGGGAFETCDVADDPTAQVVAIGRDLSGVPPEAPPTVVTDTAVDGHSAIRKAGTMPDGRSWASLRVFDIIVTVTALTDDPAVGQRILDSVRVVDVDSNGCTTRRPPDQRPSSVRPGLANAIIPGQPESISVCIYGSHRDGDRTSRLQASSRLDGAAAEALTNAANATPAGLDPDGADCQTTPAPPMWLHAHYADGPDVDVRARFAGCTDRGLDNGVRQAHVAPAVLSAAYAGLGIGFGFGADLMDVVPNPG